MKSCRGCDHYRDAAVFELCTHPRSAYTVAERSDFHSIGHMRKYECGHDAALFKQKGPDEQETTEAV